MCLHTICNLKLVDFHFVKNFYFTKLFKTILVPFLSDNYK